MGTCPVCGSSFMARDEECSDCGWTLDGTAQSPAVDRVLSGLNERQTGQLLQALWQARGRELTVRTRDGTSYLRTPDQDGKPRELIRLGRGPPTRAERDAFADTVTEHGFDRGYFVFTDGTVSAESDHDHLTLVGRARLCELIDEAGLTDSVREAYGRGDTGEGDTGRRKTDEIGDKGTSDPEPDASNDDTDAFETGPSLGRRLGRGVGRPVIVFLIALFVSLYVVGAVVNAVFGGTENTAMAVGIVACLLVAAWVGGRSALVNSDQAVLRIDHEGITIEGDRTIPWKHVKAVYVDAFEMRNPEALWYTHEFPYLVVEITGDADEVGALESLNGQLVTGDGATARVVRMKDFEADFEAVAEPVRRFSDVPVAKDRPLPDG